MHQDKLTLRVKGTPMNPSGLITLYQFDVTEFTHVKQIKLNGDLKVVRMDVDGKLIGLTPIPGVNVNVMSSSKGDGKWRYIVYLTVSKYRVNLKEVTLLVDIDGDDYIPTQLIIEIQSGTLC